jgi:dipeptidyl aminopeptidase/acylaminoacyl peptidase
MKSLLAAVLLVPAALAAQGGADVYVVPISENGSRVSVGRPVNLTKRAGYDNQPSFTRDGAAVYFTSIRDDSQADIWRVAITGGAPVRVTTTLESEYSALTTPAGDAISVIRVEPDSTQRLWKFPRDGSAPSLVLTALRPVGYHVWVGENTLGAFVLADPRIERDSNALVVVDSRTERVDTVARGIGRALVRYPGRPAFTFISTRPDTNWISEVDTRTLTVRRIAAVPRGADYHFWTPGGQLVIGIGSRLMIRVRDRWDVLADFAELGVKSISRLALSPTGTHLAFVADDGGVP